MMTFVSPITPKPISYWELSKYDDCIFTKETQVSENHEHLYLFKRRQAFWQGAMRDFYK